MELRARAAHAVSKPGTSRYHITPKRILCASELQVLDRIGYDPFDIRIAPPSPFTAPPIVPVNAPPSVTVTSPGAADTFVAPASVSVTAAAQDSDGSIQSVEFFSGSSSIGVATSSPFTVTMSNVLAGQYVLTARATDDAGAQTTSQPVVINVTSANAVAVPAVVGLTEAEATAAITAAGFALGTVSRANSGTVAAGTVISESPVAGAMVAAGSSVALVVSLGPAGVTVPNVVGQTQSSATTALTGAGLTVGAVSTATSTSIASGNVISQTPAAGASVAPGASVALVVSTGPAVTPPTLPVPWVTQDIGAVGKAGSASFAAATGTYSVSGAGADIWGTADALRFVYQTLSGDGQIVARVASVQNTNAWVKAGVMIRADLTPGSAQAMMMVTPGKGNNFQRRLTNGGVSVGTAGALVTAPYWVKLTRAGSTITAYQSSDGSTWSTVERRR